jgi:hypothetical protein
MASSNLYLPLVQVVLNDKVLKIEPMTKGMVKVKEKQERIEIVLGGSKLLITG